MNSPKKILITGARAPAALDLTRKLASLGHEVFVAESVRDYITRRSRAVKKAFHIPAPVTSFEGFIGTLEAIIRSERIDVLIPTCEEAFYIAQGSNRLRSLCEVWVDSLDQLETLHHKFKFIERVRDLGFPVPKTLLFESRLELEKALQESDPQQKLVLKPAFSRFASKTQIALPQDLLALIPRFLISRRIPYLLQDPLIGKELCTYSICKDGRVLAHVTYDHEFTAGKGAGISFCSVHSAPVEDWVSRLVRALGFTGQIAFDLMVDANGGVMPIECNPRATSGIHLLSAQQLEKAFLTPSLESDEILRPAAGALSRVGLAMWLYGLPSVRLSPRKFQSWWQILRTGQEVVYDGADPKPFWDQFTALKGLWIKSRQIQGTLLEASTADMEWNGRQHTHDL